MLTIARISLYQGLWLGGGKFWLSLCLLGSAAGAAPHITAWDNTGRLVWSNAPAPGVVTVEAAALPGTNWTPLGNAYAASGTGQVQVAVSASNQFYRLRSVSVAPTASGFTNLIQAYGLLENLAGTGEGRTDGVSYWNELAEGGSGAAAALSRPHYAMADRAGMIYIADKNSHSVLRLQPDGTIHTHCGTHSGGFNGNGPMAASELELNFPNALWVRSDGTVYVLDTENARVRRVATNGTAQTLFNAKSDTSSGLGGGRCLWVKDDETLAYFGNTDRLRQWTPGGGLQTHASGFAEIGNFFVEPNGEIVLADRGAHFIYRILTNGTRVVIAGNGSVSGGGEGFPALQTGLNGPRGIWPVPTGGYLFLLHDGAQLWYMDASSTMHLLVNGQGGNGFVHEGDGQYFYAPEQLRIGEGRSVSMDYAGNIIVCESDYGFIRRIRFHRMTP